MNTGKDISLKGKANLFLSDTIFKKIASEDPLVIEVHVVGTGSLTPERKTYSRLQRIKNESTKRMKFELFKEF